MHSAPLWLRRATEPSRAIDCAKVALSLAKGLITPKQFGPTKRTLPRRASASVSCSSCAPAAPISLKPAEMMTAPPTPASPHSRMTPGTVAAGVTTTARSSLPGASVSEGYVGTPNTSRRCGFTPQSAPGKPPLTRFSTTVRPTLPSRSVAPITATDLGRKMTSSGLGSPRRTSCERSVRKSGAAVMVSDTRFHLANRLVPRVVCGEGVSERIENKRVGRRGVYPPGKLHEYQNKGVAAKGSCMNMKTKGECFCVVARQLSRRNSMT